MYLYYKQFICFCKVNFPNDVERVEFMRRLLLTILFPASVSPHLGQALTIAQAQKTFTENNGPEGLRYSVTFAAPEELEPYRLLWAMVRNWKGSQHLLDGVEIPFDSVQETLDCFSEGQRLGNKDWCFGDTAGSVGFAPLFPCRFIPISEANHLGWFQYGSMNREKVFIVDKIKLRQRINYYLEKSNARFCPLLDGAAIDEIVRQLPSRIDPQKDEEWTYKQGWVKGRFQVIGVEKKQSGTRTLPSAKPEKKETPDKTVKTEINQTAERDIPLVRYHQIGGLDSVISQVRESVELPMKMPQLFTHMGITPHRGILLYGPPGTGKTLIAKALANECQAHFIFVNGPELISKWHGETESNLRKIFEEAKAKAPSVILFDEVDALTPNRDQVTLNYEAVAVSQLLSLMDGLVERGNVVVIGTTNRPQSVDAALKRPGRLDLHLEVGYPDLAGRRDILRIHTAAMPLADDVDLLRLAELTPDSSGADLASLCREAGLLCIREKITISMTEGVPDITPEEILELTVRQEHFLQALNNRKE